MKKKIYVLMGLLICFVCIFLTACDNSGNILQNGDKNIVSIEVDDATIPDKIVVGKFDEASIELIVNYSDGSKDTLAITSTFIPEEDKHYLNEEGTYTINILYRNMTTEITLNIIAYEVNYYAKNGNNETVIISTQKVNSLEELVAPTAINEIYTDSKKYTFVEWGEYAKGGTDADIVINAVYNEVNLYTVNFYNGNEALISSQKIEEGANAIEPQESDKAMDGYKFLGWDRSYLNVCKNINVYGVYYNITSDENDYSIYTATNESGYPYQYILFGKYPQTLVNDTELITSLSSATDIDNDGYIEYLNEEYVAVVAVANETNSTTTFRNGTAMVEGTTYYFKVEPIKWRVYDLGNGEYELISEYILDEQQMNLQVKDNSGYYFSEMREYLNNTFYNKAFSAEEKELIISTLVDNTTASGNCIDNENTNDFVYLLSYNDLMSDKYGFDVKDTRIALNTDYTMANGVYTNGIYNNSGDWWLRTIASEEYEDDYEWYSLDSYYCVFSDNRVESHSENGEADTNTYGIRPVIRITLE